MDSYTEQMNKAYKAEQQRIAREMLESFNKTRLCPEKIIVVDPPAESKRPSALDVQVSGDHYKNHKIQPIEYIHANNIPFAEGCVIKYVSRWRQKGGIKDLEKARHFLDLLIELETRNAPPHDSLADRISQQEQA